MMNRHLTSVLTPLLLSLLPLMAEAQESEYQYNDAVQLWRNTSSAAALTADSTANRGYAEFSFDRTVGSYHRIQEGESHNEFTFFTERYQNIGKYLYGYGSFRFGMGRTQERAWSDVMRTYFSNPFISGSSVPGKYDNQDFSLSARVGTVELSGWRFGAGLDYSVGDLSRLRDPRSRSRLLDYKITPSVAYSFGGSTLGIAGWYHRRKEKMPTLTTVQNNPNLYYYQMTGLDAVTGTIGGYSGYSREYLNHELGAELEYGFKAGAFQTVNTVGVSQATDYMYEQYKREPGRYYTYRYALTSQNRIVSDDMIHQIDLNVDAEQSYADEYRPQLVINIDPTTGYKSYHYDNIMTYRKRYQFEAMNLALHYRLNRTVGNAVRNYFGASASMATLSQKHLLPTSTFDLNSVTLNAEYGQALLPGNRLWLTLDLGYMLRTKSDMQLADSQNLYATQVLLPDMKYYEANCFNGRLGVRYQFPLTIKKIRSMWYVKGYVETLHAQNSLSSKVFGISLGIYN